MNKILDTPAEPIVRFSTLRQLGLKNKLQSTQLKLTVLKIKLTSLSYFISFFLNDDQIEQQGTILEFSGSRVVDPI